MPVIKFIPIDEYAEVLCDPPVPAVNVLPEWYKNMSTIMPDVKLSGELTNSTMKRCMPVFDYITSGYYISTWSDIYFENHFCEEDGCTEQELIATWRVNRSVLSNHPSKQFTGIEVPPGYYMKAAFKLENQFVIKTPRGYSTLFLPVPEVSPTWAIPGIVDTDIYPVAINFPFLLKENFSGLLKKGTPIVKAIPFKRESWDSEVLKHEGNKRELLLERLKTMIHHGYKQTMWSKKHYK